MIQLSLEIPTSMLKRWSPLLDLDFVLAHKVLQDTEYASFFALRTPGREVILDNSTHEFGKPIPLSELRRAAELVKADIVIAPDIVNPEMGQTQFQLNIDWLVEAAEALKEYSIGAVLCGHTKTERELYLHHALGVAEVMFFTFHMPQRLEWWQDFTKHKNFRFWERVHLLGVSSLDELRRWVEISNEHPDILFSVDTSKPLKWGVQEKKLDDIQGSLRGGTIASKEVLDISYFTDTQIECVEHNIKLLRKICRGEA